MMLLGSGLTEVYLMGVAIGRLAFGKGRCLPWEFLVFFLCVVYLGSPVGTNWLGMSFAILEHPSSHQYPPALPVPLSSTEAALLLSLVRTRLSRDVCALSTLLPTPKSCQSQWPLGASSKPGKQGTHVCDSFYSLFFFSGVGLSNYPTVYANTEEALGASSGALLLLGTFYFPNRICQTYSFLFRQLTFHLSCSRNSSLWGLVILYLKYSKAEGKCCLPCLPLKGLNRALWLHI